MQDNNNIKFVIQKEVRHKASILGLDVRFFYVFLAVFIMMVIPLFSGLSFVKLITAIVLIVGVYLALFFLESFDIQQFFKTLPNKLINR